MLRANWKLGQDKTRLSSHRISRLDKTVSKFSVTDSLVLSPFQFTPRTPTRQDLSCRCRRWELGIRMLFDILHSLVLLCSHSNVTEVRDGTHCQPTDNARTSLFGAITLTITCWSPEHHSLTDNSALSTSGDVGATAIVYYAEAAHT